MSIKCGFNTHHLGVDNVYPVPVSQPDPAVHLDHAPDSRVGNQIHFHALVSPYFNTINY